MQNLLIIEDNLIYSHFLVNSICKELNNIRLYSIVDTGKKALEILKKEKIDIIILDLKLPDISGIDIINYIEGNNLSQYYASIIVLTNEIDLLNQVINKKSVFTYSSKIDNIDSFIDKVRELSKEKQDISLKNSIKEKISSELEYLGFDFSYIGTRYLYDCIYECYLSDTLYNINFSKHIYPILAKKYNKSQVLIKANIFQMLNFTLFQPDNRNYINTKASVFFLCVLQVKLRCMENIFQFFPADCLKRMSKTGS